MANVLIVGASRGIGLGLVRRYLDGGHTVFAVARKLAGAAGLTELASQHRGRLTLIEADLTDTGVAAQLSDALAQRKLDILIVNAGIKPDSDDYAQLDAGQIARLFATNALAPMALARALAPRIADGGVAAFLSSQMGSVALARSASLPLYGASKAALNSLMQSWAAEQGSLRFALLALHPGWVRTDMGGQGADIGVDESVAGLVATIDAHAGRPVCAFVDYRNQTLAW